MQWQYVRSSRMSAVAWENNTTYIRFNDDVVYAYDNVSYEQHIAFISSPSLGRALTYFEKQHPYRRV